MSPSAIAHAHNRPHEDSAGRHDADSTQAVSIRGLSAAYDEIPVLVDIDLDIPRGHLVTFVGPNGAGKSTLFKVLVGIIAPSTGSVQVLGQDGERARARGDIAYMPQQEQIDWDFPASVRDVVMSARYSRMLADGGLRRFLPVRFALPAHRERVDAALAAVDLHDLADRPIGSLSGGQKKRTLLARVLAQDASILLLDEPLTGVDRTSEALIMRVLHQERDQGRTVITVTHDLASARAHADHVVLLNRSVVASGHRDDMLTDEMLTRTATARWMPAVARREHEVADHGGPRSHGGEP